MAFCCLIIYTAVDLGVYSTVILDKTSSHDPFIGKNQAVDLPSAGFEGRILLLIWVNMVLGYGFTRRYG
jgi:hypothetical protein